MSLIFLVRSILDRTHVFTVPQFAQPSALVPQGVRKLIILR